MRSKDICGRLFWTEATCPNWVEVCNLKPGYAGRCERDGVKEFSEGEDSRGQ